MINIIAVAVATATTIDEKTRKSFIWSSKLEENILFAPKMKRTWHI